MCGARGRWTTSPGYKRGGGHENFNKYCNKFEQLRRILASLAQQPGSTSMQLPSSRSLTQLGLELGRTGCRMLDTREKEE